MENKVISKIKKIFLKLIEIIKDISNISFMPIWMEPFGHMTKEQEAEIMKLVREDKEKTNQKKRQEKDRLKQQKKESRHNIKQQKQKIRKQRKTKKIAQNK